MKLDRSTLLTHLIVMATLFGLVVSPVYATCGGGGGGGTGGIAVGPQPTVYYVPWVVVEPGNPQPAGDLVLYWFPTSRDEALASNLRTSRNLTLLSARCLGVALVPGDNTELRARYQVSPDRPIAILSAKDGTEIRRIEPERKHIPAAVVEKVVQSELDQRKEAIKEALEQAKGKEKAGDTTGAAEFYTQVAEQACLFPKEGKKAAKALKKMGREVPAVAALGNFEPADLRPTTSARISELMEAGLAAERAERPAEAQGYYERARKVDPADPVVLRFLGELHRHHTGDWKLARAIFGELLERPADRLSRAVALHGIGKMTIHSGDFEQGVALFERSLDEYPLPLTYRNLAVFWNSEDQREKAYGYVKKAMELAPEDPYNQVFAATYLVALGHTEEAIRLAEEHEDMLAASYNLAAIYAQLGDRQKAFDFLRRHFYEYEHYDAVRAKEMQEARDDIVFAQFHKDREFIELTALAATNQESYHYDATR